MAARAFFALVICFGLCSVLAAAEGGGKEKKGDGKAGDGKAAEAKGPEDNRVGTLGPKPVTADAGVLAMLYTAGTDYSLSGGDDIAQTLQDLAKKGAKVRAYGTVDGNKIKVSRIVELDAKPEDAKKGKKKDKSDKKKDGADSKAKKTEQN
ncbi:MAG TPA: hypothetical protein VGP72_13125 [Planctomycetota bacterium]|jgi:hypothetical protein